VVENGYKKCFSTPKLRTFFFARLGSTVNGKLLGRSGGRGSGGRRKSNQAESGSVRPDFISNVAENIARVEAKRLVG
jgi:hypothetical protein